MVFSSGAGLPGRDIKRIEREVKQAAFDHLHAPNAAAALNDYAENAVLVSNARWYSSDEWAELVEEFYGTMREVHIAEWEETRVDVLSADAAAAMAKFHWSSTDTSGVTIDLRGVWTALYVREARGWKIRLRHESFEPVEE